MLREDNLTEFFDRSISGDPIIADAIASEVRRQDEQIELIASENIVSPAVLAALGTVFTNKYAEGYPYRRYYGGCEHADVIELTAIRRATRLFDCGYANVQPHSGAQANTAVLMALTKPGDTILGMSLDAGGHLTHGAKPTLSGKWFNAVHYGVDRDTNLIDYDTIEALAIECQPRLIIAGGSAIPRQIDFARFRDIAEKVGAWLLVDMAHFAGLVAGGAHPSPIQHAHVVTTTTHKTLRGPRGGMILTSDEAIAKKVDSAVFPGIQGGPLMHVIAAKAVAFGEALQPDFRTYTNQVVANARMMCAGLVARGFDIVSGGTDTHLALVDLRSKRLSGRAAELSLERAGLTCNKNGIPFDPLPPAQTSGIRLGSPAATTRGFGSGEFAIVAELIADVLDGLASNPEDNSVAESVAREGVAALTGRFPIYRSGGPLPPALFESD